MKSTKFLIALCIITILSLNSITASAAIISNSGEEVAYTYETEFRALARSDSENKIDPRALADFHALHLYGLFQSAEYVSRYGLPPDLYEGFAGTMFPEIVSAKIIKKNNDPYLWVRYKARGKMLVIKTILQNWLGNRRSGHVTLPLLADLSLIYLDDLSDYRSRSIRKCTDANHLATSDFSYFYTPFLCPELSSPPIAQDVTLQINRVGKSSDTKIKIPLEKIHADNGNGKLTVLYFIYGFDGYLASGSDSQSIHKDAGWKLYKSLHKDLEKTYNFENIQSSSDFKTKLGDDIKNIAVLTPVTMVHDIQRRYFSTHLLRQGDHTIVVRSALFDTTNDVSSTPLLSFPKFWKEAWENGDFIYYGGHSGDGASLNISSMINNLERADIGAIGFNNKKTQIAFIDACSSYAHFLEMYKKLKPNNLHFITYGIVSLFHLAESTVQSALSILLKADHSLTWQNALQEIERNQLIPHIEYYYGRKNAASVIRKYQRKNEYPQMLISVSASD